VRTTALIKTTVNILAHICPTDKNCDFILWAGQRKLMFRVAAIFAALPQHSGPSSKTQESFVRFLNSAPEFIVINSDRLVHIADHLSRMPTEEGEDYCSQNILWAAMLYWKLCF
jgi:hypothetical protein